MTDEIKNIARSTMKNTLYPKIRTHLYQCFQRIEKSNPNTRFNFQVQTYGNGAAKLQLEAKKNKLVVNIMINGEITCHLYSNVSGEISRFNALPSSKEYNPTDVENALESIKCFVTENYSEILKDILR